MSWSVELVPLFPMVFYSVSGIVAVLLVGLMLLRRTRGALFRGLALGVLLLALLNPMLKQEDRDALANIALVVVDETTSQALSDRPEQTLAIREALEARLGRVENLEVKTIVAKSANDGRITGTRLFSELNAELATTPSDRIAGVILVSDGQVHDVPETTAGLGFDAPIHVLLSGRQGEFDRRIEIIKAPRYGIVGQSREIEVRITQSGEAPPQTRPLNLRVRRQGEPDEVRRVGIGRRVKIDMPFPHAGLNIVELDIEAADGELTPANNRTVVTAQGVRENLRVLLVSGEPHAGERTWRNLLKSDAAVDLVHFTILRPPEKQDGTPINQLSLIAFPTRELFSEKIRDFDLIIFDRYQHRGILQLLYYDNISRYVSRNGGAVLVAAGDDYAGSLSLYRTPLAPVLPAIPTGRVIEEPFRAKITEEGRRHPVTRDLPGLGPEGGDPTWGRWFRQVEVRSDRGSTIMTGADDQPLLVLDRRGEGRVALMTSDQAWLWARGFDGGGPHTALLRRLSHWLMKEPDLEEEQLFADAKGLRLTLERRTMLDVVSPVEVLAPNDQKQTVELEKVREGLWQATIDVRLPGLYKATTQGPEDELTAVAHAGAQDVREMSEVTATRERLTPIVEQTGGGIFWSAGGDLVATGEAATGVDVPRVTTLSGARIYAGSNWLALRDRQAFLTKGVALTPLFEGLLGLAALLFIVSLAWWREGR